MTTPETEIVIDPVALPLADPPPIPSLTATGPKRPTTLRSYAQKLVERLGPPAALMLAAEIDEAVAELESGSWR
jgi:hypothetical protein